MTDDGEVVRALLTRLYNEDDLKAADELMAPGLADRYRSHAQRLRDSSEDMRIEVIRIVDDGRGHVAVLYRRVGTHTGPMRGPYVDALSDEGVAHATRQRINARSVWFAVVEDGGVEAVDSVADNLTLFQQVGLIQGPPIER